MDEILQIIFFKSQEPEEEIHFDKYIKKKFMNCMKISLRLMYIFIFLRLWNKTLIYLKYSFISLKEYDALIRIVEHKNRIIANTAKELIERKPNECKTRERKIIKNKRISSSHF